MISRGSAVFRLPIGFAPSPVKQCAPKRAIRAESLFLSLVFLLKRCERSRVAAERIGGGYSLAFFCSRGTLVSHTKFQTSSCLFFSHVGLARVLSPRPAKHTRAHTNSPSLGRLKPFPRFYILDEIPAALCPFITFANQMMSLDILRLGFIVAFYAGRTASVKRIRAERSRLIGYHIEIRSLSRSRFLDRQPLRPFSSSSSHGHVRTSYTVLLPLYCRIFRGNFPCEITRLPCTRVSFYDKVFVRYMHLECNETSLRYSHGRRTLDFRTRKTRRDCPKLIKIIQKLCIKNIRE